MRFYNDFPISPSYLIFSPKCSFHKQQRLHKFYTTGIYILVYMYILCVCSVHVMYYCTTSSNLPQPLSQTPCCISGLPFSILVKYIPVHMCMAIVSAVKTHVYVIMHVHVQCIYTVKSLSAI